MDNFIEEDIDIPKGALGAIGGGDRGAPPTRTEVFVYLPKAGERQGASSAVVRRTAAVSYKETAGKRRLTISTNERTFTLTPKLRNSHGNASITLTVKLNVRLSAHILDDDEKLIAFATRPFDAKAACDDALSEAIRGIPLERLREASSIASLQADITDRISDTLRQRLKVQIERFTPEPDSGANEYFKMLDLKDSLSSQVNRFRLNPEYLRRLDMATKLTEVEQLREAILREADALKSLEDTRASVRLLLGQSDQARDLERRLDSAYSVGDVEKIKSEAEVLILLDRERENVRKLISGSRNFQDLDRKLLAATSSEEVLRVKAEADSLLTRETEIYELRGKIRLMAEHLDELAPGLYRARNGIVETTMDIKTLQEQLAFFQVADEIYTVVQNIKAIGADVPDALVRAAVVDPSPQSLKRLRDAFAEAADFAELRDALNVLLSDREKVAQAYPFVRAIYRKHRNVVDTLKEYFGKDVLERMAAVQTKGTKINKPRQRALSAGKGKATNHEPPTTEENQPTQEETVVREVADHEE